MPPPAPAPLHQGVTFEANLGFGLVHVTDSGSSVSLDTNMALAGVNLGIGGWISPRTALTFRVSDVDVRIDNAQNGTVVAAFLGPSIQYWTDSNIWFGAGAGLATLVAITNCSGNCSNNGFGLDLRLGYTFPSTALSTFNVSLEMTPGFYGGANGSSGGTATGVAILVGYQHL